MATTVMVIIDAFAYMCSEITRECPLIEIDFEEGDLTDFTSTVNPDDDLTAEIEHGLAGTGYGMEVTIDDTNPSYGQYALADAIATGVLRVRLYIDPSDLDMTSGDEFILFEAYNSSTQNIMNIALNYNVADLRIRASLANDVPADEYTGYYIIADGVEHYIEVLLLRSTSDGASDGSLQLWIDGASKETLSGKDNFDRFSDFKTLRAGAVSGMDAGTEGHIAIDEIIVNATGTLIGAR